MSAAVPYAAPEPLRPVLLIAYYFPPDGSAGVYRPLRFVRHLSRYGWRASVLTLDTETYVRYDPGLLDLIPEGVEIVKVAERDAWRRIQSKRETRTRARLKNASPEESSKVHRSHYNPLRSFVRRIVRTIEATVYYPDLHRFWIRPAVAAAVEICQVKRPEAMIVTGGPWSAFKVVHEAWRRTAVPYVLDFRDSWTLTHNEDFEAFRPRWAAGRDRQLLRRFFADAQAVIFRYWSEAEAYWRAYPGALTAEKIHIVPNGYDGSIEAFDAPSGDRCTILYAGTVAPYRYDTLLDAVTRLRASNPADARRLRLLFVGEGGDHLARAAKGYGLTDVVETMAPVPARELERLQRGAHALLLLGVRPYQGYELCGSKVFAYLKAGRPIVGVLPEDEMKGVLERVGVSTVADVESPASIAQVLQCVITAWSEGRLERLLPDPDACRTYSSDAQIEAVARALSGAPALTPFRPGVVDIPTSLKDKIGPNGWIAAR